MRRDAFLVDGDCFDRRCACRLHHDADDRTAN
jgi:hypothetical protein